MQANGYRRDENYGQVTATGNQECRRVYDSRKSSRKTYGANRTRVDDASRETGAVDEGQCTSKQYSIYKALNARARPFVEPQ